MSPRRRALAGSLPTQMAPYEDEEILAKYSWLPQAGQMITEGKGLPAVTKQTQLVEIVGRHLANAGGRRRHRGRGNGRCGDGAGRAVVGFQKDG